MERRIDRVGVTGAVTALVACLALPFVDVRANRLVAGVPERLWVAGPAAGAFVLACAVALGAALLRPSPGRAVALKVGSGAMLATLTLALGVAAGRLLAGLGDIARVSLGAGAWLALVGAAVVTFAAGRALRERRRLRLALDALTLLAVVGAAALGGIGQLSIAREYAVQQDTFWTAVVRHLALAGTGLGFGVLIGVPLGVFAVRHRAVREVSLGVVGVIQTIPSLAMLGLLILPLASLRVASPLLASLGVSGIGFTPAAVALTLYALLPVVRNTYVGLAEVDPAIVDAGRGMGMGRLQLLLKVEAPLALPLILEGVRSAAVLVVGIAAVTALVGAGGLGVLIFLGLGQQADDLVLLGAVPIILLALVADVAMRGLGRAVVSPGVRGAS